MAKKFNKEKALAATAKRIEVCKICKGKPKVTPFDIPEYSGIKCDTCFEIINYEQKNPTTK